MPERSYRQDCALARALDVIGDRWALLIVRNLILGPLRWSDLVDTLPGIAKNLLSARLSALEADGVVGHQGDLYYLTDQGAALEKAVFALADWGERHVVGPPRPGEAFRLRYFMTAVRRKLRDPAVVPLRISPSRPAWIQLWVSGEPYAVRVAPEPTVEQGERPAAAVLRADVGALRDLLFDSAALEGLIESGRVEVEGDPRLIQAWASAIRVKARPGP